jgi:hypothetical protein
VWRLLGSGGGGGGLSCTGAGERKEGRTSEQNEMSRAAQNLNRVVTPALLARQTVAPESLARQHGPHGTPCKSWSTLRSTVDPLVAPAHVARLSAATKRVSFTNNIVLGLVLKYCLKKD